MEWLYQHTDPILETVLGAILIVFFVILFSRIVGLRSFAKFSVYDFALTVAIGSIISATLTSSTTIIHGVVAIGSLLVLTYIVSYLQKNFDSVDKITSNKPLLLMRNDEIIHKNLKKANVKTNQLMAKLREANVFDKSQILAVVLETTGDISVIHSNSNKKFKDIDSQILEDIQQ